MNEWGECSRQVYDSRLFLVKHSIFIDQSAERPAKLVVIERNNSDMPLWLCRKCIGMYPPDFLVLIGFERTSP